MAADEREGGLRAVLNYGHTFGHVVEALCGYGTWLHGEAVALGMVAVGELAVQRGNWSRIDAERQKQLLGKPTALTAPDQVTLHLQQPSEAGTVPLQPLGRPLHPPPMPTMIRGESLTPALVF